jgi:uncharacterized protein YecA (UPF0149 family)
VKILANLDKLAQFSFLGKLGEADITESIQRDWQSVYMLNGSLPGSMW